MAGLPIDVSALIKASAKLKEDRDLPVRLVVLVELDTPDELLDALQVELKPKTLKGYVDVAAIEVGSIMRVDASVDAAIVLVGSGANDVVPTLRDLRQRAIPAVVVALREERGHLPVLVEHPERDVIVGTDPAEVVVGPLADWIMDRLPGKRTAIAHNFAFVRRAMAKEAMKATAWQNALIGGVTIIPGADMPVMTLNQGKMILQMAAAYGQDLGADRVWELGAVVGGGLVFRTVARQALTLVPGFGWALKAGVAYAGTIAMGEAAIVYFESGASLPEVLEGLKTSAADAVERVKQHRLESEGQPSKLDGLRRRFARGRYTDAADEEAPVAVEGSAPDGQLAIDGIPGAGGE